MNNKYEDCLRTIVNLNRSLFSYNKSIKICRASKYLSLKMNERMDRTLWLKRTVLILRALQVFEIKNVNIQRKKIEKFCCQSNCLSFKRITINFPQLPLSLSRSFINFSSFFSFFQKKKKKWWTKTEDRTRRLNLTDGHHGIHKTALLASVNKLRWSG